MKAAMRSRGIVPMPLWAVRTATCPPLAMVTGVQVRAKHYISYRLEGEDDPYRHLRRRKSPAKKTRSSLHSGGEEASMMGETEEEASRSSSSLASFLFGHPDSDEPGPRPAEAAAAMEQRRTEVVTGMGMGMGGGVVHRSKAVMPSRRRFVEGTAFGGAGGQHNHQQDEQEQRLRQEQPPTPQDAQADERRQKGGPMADAPRVEGEHEHDHNHQPAVWVPQAVRDTSKKVLESVGGAAASVGHTAKQVFAPLQLWDGALTSMGAHRPDHQHEGLMEKAKDVGKGTAHVVDTGYERAIEKAADKMLEALDASLRRAKARGFPPGLTVTTIASAMGAQLIMAYTTKEEDAGTPTGRKDENVAQSKRPASRTTAQRGQAKKSSGATEEAAAGASGAAQGRRMRNRAAPKQDSPSS